MFHACHIVNFDAKQALGQTQLVWKTADKQDFDRLEIELFYKLENTVPLTTSFRRRLTTSYDVSFPDFVNFPALASAIALVHQTKLSEKDSRSWLIGYCFTYSVISVNLTLKIRQLRKLVNRRR